MCFIWRQSLKIFAKYFTWNFCFPKSDWFSQCWATNQIPGVTDFTEIFQKKCNKRFVVRKKDLIASLSKSFPLFKNALLSFFDFLLFQLLSQKMLRWTCQIDTTEINQKLSTQEPSVIYEVLSWQLYRSILNYLILWNQKTFNKKKQLQTFKKGINKYRQYKLALLFWHPSMPSAEISICLQSF